MLQKGDGHSACTDHIGLVELLKMQPKIKPRQFVIATGTTRVTSVPHLFSFDPGGIQLKRSYEYDSHGVFQGF